MEDRFKAKSIAQKIEERAERVRNENDDVVSKLARGILDAEVWIARRVQNSRETELVPSEFQVSQEKQNKFYTQLKVIEDDITLGLRKQCGPYSDPGAVPIPNMCGYAACALTEAYRSQGVEARVVYGHYSQDGGVKYHYWTEVKSKSGKTYAIDATYGQFDPNYKDQIIVYPVSELANHGLNEYKSGDPQVLVWDIPTLKALGENDGIIPLKQDLDGKRLEAYNELVASLS